jgi:hypothetical protein
MNPFDDRFNSEIFKNAALARGLLSNPALSAALEFQEKHSRLFDYWNSLTNSHHLKMIRDAQDTNSRLEIFSSSRALAATRDFLLHDTIARRMIDSSQWQALLESQRPQSDVFSRTNLATARAISEVTQFISRNAYLHTFPQSFTAEMLDRLSSIEEPRDGQGLEEFKAGLQNLLQLIVEKCDELAVDPNTYWAMIKFAFTIFVFLYPLYDSHLAEKQVVDSIDKTRAEILRQIEQLRPSEINEAYYVVNREARIRIRPQSRSTAIQVLAPNQTLKLVKSKGKWIYVEYFDYIEGLPKSGWVLKKYTKRIKSVQAKGISPSTSDPTSYLLDSPLNRAHLLQAVADVENSHKIVVPDQEQFQ